MKDTVPLTKQAVASGCATLLARISGFIRDIITANLFGATLGYDAFILAFRIPNLMRRLFAEGAFSQAFVPVFAEYTQQKTHNEIKSFIDKITGNLALVLLLVTLIGVMLAPWLIKIAAPGFDNTSPEHLTKFNHAVSMLRIVLPYIFFISLTALAAGILNCYQQFLVPAFTPVLLNLSFIGCSLMLAKKCTPPELSLACGVIVGGILQLIFQLPFLAKLNLLPNAKIDWQDRGVKRILTLMIPAMLGAAIGQINIIIDSIFASFLATGSITWLYYADRLMEFPLGIFGVSFATVILPQLSRAFANKHDQQFAMTLCWGIKCAVLVGLPASLTLLLLSKPIMSTLFLTGKFSTHDVIMSSQSLIGYALSVLGIMLAKIFANGFYAVGDLTTPVRIGSIILLTNIICNSLLIKPFQHVGIACSTSIASIMHAGILGYLLLQKNMISSKHITVNYRYGMQLLIAGLSLAGFLHFYPAPTEQWLIWSTPYKCVRLTEILLLSAMIYFGVLHICGFKLKHILLNSGHK